MLPIAIVDDTFMRDEFSRAPRRAIEEYLRHRLKRHRALRWERFDPPGAPKSTTMEHVVKERTIWGLQQLQAKGYRFGLVIVECEFASIRRQQPEYPGVRTRDCWEDPTKRKLFFGNELTFISMFGMGNLRTGQTFKTEGRFDKLGLALEYRFWENWTVARTRAWALMDINFDVTVMHETIKCVPLEAVQPAAEEDD